MKRFAVLLAVALAASACTSNTFAGRKILSNDNFVVIPLPPANAYKEFCCQSCESNPNGPGGTLCLGCQETGPASCPIKVICRDDHTCPARVQ
jgi:hypothetical protein